MGLLTLMRRRGVVYTYAFRDRFFTDQAAPLTTPRVAVPGQGSEVLTGAARFKILGGRLRAVGQATSPVWGETKIVGYSDAAASAGFSRVTGRTFAVLLSIEDFTLMVAAGWATADNITDPRTDGYGIVTTGDTGATPSGGGISVITPGLQVLIGGQIQNTRSIQYLLMFVLNSVGAAVLVAPVADDSGDNANGPIPIFGYPNARLLWWKSVGSEATLYPYLTFYDEGGGSTAYPNGHAIEDMRVVDVASWAAADALATVSDRFTRANSTSVIGGPWTVVAGTWGINSNRGYMSALAAGAFNFVTAPGSADGLFTWTVTFGASGTPSFACVLRYVDTTHHVMVTSNGTLNTVVLRVVGGTPTVQIYGGAFTWTYGQTYEIKVAAYGNQYNLWIDGAQIGWTTDTGSNYLAATLFGFAMHGGFTVTPATYFDNVACLPHSISIPPEIRAGRRPTVLAGAATLASDTFTGTNGTRLNAHAAGAGGAWTEYTPGGHNLWTIQSNRATVTITTGINALAYQTLATTDAECQLDVLTPASYPTTTILAGIAIRVTDSANYMYAVVLRAASQVGSDEIECHEVIAGVDSVVKKTSIGVRINVSGTYTLKVQAYGDLIQAFLDGKPRCAWYTSQTFAGTGFGLFRHQADDGCVLDNWSVKAL